MTVQATGTRSQDEGFSLVEVLISVAILGIAFASILGGLGTSILASDIHRQQADVHSVLLSAVEAVKDEDRNAYTCTTASYSPTNLVTLPSGWSSSAVLISSVISGYWDGSGFSSATCSTATPVQKITITVTAPSGRATESLTFLKRQP